MKILITGIDGFIGKHLSKALVKRGHRVHKGGNVLNKKQIEEKIKDIDCVIHLAAKTSHFDIAENKFETLEINLTGTKNVLEAFLKSKKTKKFIFPSSGKVYGKIKNLPITENHPKAPLNILGKSKLIAEQLIDFYANNDKEFIIFRIFNVYGEDQKENFLIPTILKQVKGKKEIVLGDVKAKRDYLYIDDLMNAFVLAVEKNEKKGLSIYNICGGVSYSAQDIVKLIEKIKGQKIKVKTNPSLIRLDEMKNEYGSFKLIRKELGWRPEVSIEKGLKKILSN